MCRSLLLLCTVVVAVGIGGAKQLAARACCKSMTPRFQAQSEEGGNHPSSPLSVPLPKKNDPHDVCGIQQRVKNNNARGCAYKPGLLPILLTTTLCTTVAQNRGWRRSFVSDDMCGVSFHAKSATGSRWLFDLSGQNNEPELLCNCACRL